MRYSQLLDPCSSESDNLKSPRFPTPLSPLRLFARGELWVLSPNEAWDHFTRFLRLLPKEVQFDIRKRLMKPEDLQMTQLFADIANKAGTCELAAVGLAIWRAGVFDETCALDDSEQREFD